MAQALVLKGSESGNGLILGAGVAGKSIIPATPDNAQTFGAETLAGAGAIPLPSGASGIDNAGGTNLVDDGANVYPDTGGGVSSGTVTFTGSSVEWEVTAIANKATVASAAELVSAFNSIPTSTATGILVRDGDYSSSSRMTPTAKVFTNQMTIEPAEGFTPAATPESNTYTVTLPSIFLAANTENVRIYGLEFYETLDDAPGESSGIVEVESGGTSANITVEACKISSRLYTDAYDNGIIGDSTGFSSYASQGAFFTALNQLRGVRANDVANFRLLDCYIHDVTRGFSGGDLTIDSGNRSRISGNYFSNVLTNFTTVGGQTNGLDIWDNRGIHTWGSDLEVPSNPLHGAVGLSFDPPGSAGQYNQNMSIMGNIFHVGWARKKYTEDSGDTYTATNSSTGAKFNDPNLDASNSYTYFNITFAFNVLCTGGIGIEFSGADSIDIFNNTLLQDDEGVASGSYPFIYFQAAANTRAWNNLGAKLTLGALDGDSGSFYGATLDDFEGYGNEIVTFENYYKSDAQGNHPYLEISDFETAFEPDAGRHALTADQKKGALGTGLYSGGGVHSVTYDPPSPTAGTAGTYDTTVWDGSTNYVSGISSPFSSTLKQFTLFFQGSFDGDGTEEYLFGNQFRAMEVYRDTNNNLVVYGKNSSSDFTLTCVSEFTLTASDGVVSIAVAVDMDLGLVQMVKNGVQDRFNGDYDLIEFGDSVDGSNSGNCFAKFSGASLFDGDVDFLWLGSEFFDLDNQTNIETLYTSAGAFQDFGSDGSTPTGTQPEFFLNGTAAGFSNDGSYGSVTINGTLSDA